MKVTMDRYEANWEMVKTGWETHVLGEGRMFKSAKEAIETYREELGVIDQDLPAFVIAKDGKPVGTIEDEDSVVFFNFRGDRAIEISRAFEDKDFDIVIIDIRMGDIDGIQVMEKVFQKSRRIKVIMITGYATLELARESLTKGAFDFIAKPFKVKEVRKAIKKAAELLEQSDQTTADHATA